MPKILLRAWLLATLLVCVPWLAAARDAFVLISGGGTQLSNNYSQYLQARAIEAWFHTNYPKDSTWVFFGAGNREGETPVFGDVRRQTKVDGLVVDGWVPGSLRDNRPAKRDIILRALREEIMPAVSDGGTLYLFVGDHGHLTRGKDPESAISLWTLEPSKDARRGWRSNREEELSVSALREPIVAGLGKGRVVFVMTQCHSGGFHHLAVPRKMQANPEWFSTQSAPAPAWAMPQVPFAAGFTATDEQSLAAGCDPSPDPESWAGYERYLPEQLLGLDLFSLGKGGTALPSFAEAHEQATLVDQTIDKPMSTSEQYLERWADLIETELMDSKNLTAEMARHVAAYRRNVDTGRPDYPPAGPMVDRLNLFSRFIRRMAEQNPSARDLLLSGTQKELEEVAGPRGRSGGGGSGRRRGGASDSLQKVWTDTVRPAWKSAVRAGEVQTIPAAALEFEKHLLSLEDSGRDFLLRERDAMPSEVFWESGYRDPATVDTAKAAAVARWAAERRDKIQEWAKQSPDAGVKEGGEKLADAAPPRLGERTAPRTLSRRTAAQRVLFYRRVMAAWAFLMAANEQPALEHLQQFIELERTPLPQV
jgi:hypothetical protein